VNPGDPVNPGDEPDPLRYLEPDQLVADKSRPLARAHLSRRARIGLWALRVLAVGIGAMVVYTFVSQLGQ
jgi:hypothetical protein